MRPSSEVKDAYAYLVLWWQFEDKANLITKKKTHSMCMFTNNQDLS